MIEVLVKLEQIKAKIMYAIVAGHSFIPVTRLMLLSNHITRILGHFRPLHYSPPQSHDSTQRKVYDALDDSHKELFDLLTSRRNDVIDEVGESEWENLKNLLADFSIIKDRAFDSEHGRGSSLLKRGRKFTQIA